MFCRELGIGIVPYSPLGRGFFGGKVVDENAPANTFLVWNLTYFQPFVYSFFVPLNFLVKNIIMDLDDFDIFTFVLHMNKHGELMTNLLSYQRLNPRFQGENFEKNKNIYTKMEMLAEKHRCTPAQLALAWVLHQGDDVAPIPGESRVLPLNLACKEHA